jgi:hypothetical protein
MVTFSEVAKAVILVVFIVLIGYVFFKIVSGSNPIGGLLDFFSQEHKPIINLQIENKPDKSVLITWTTREQGIDFVVYEMSEDTPEKEPSEPAFEKSSIAPKSENNNEKWSWQSSKLSAGSHFFIVVPVKDGKEINEESSNIVIGSFYDDRYITSFTGEAGGCSAKDCGVANCKDKDKCSERLKKELGAMGFTYVK